MSDAVDGRIQVPTSVKAGEAFPVRVVIRHPMESGLRFDNDGKAVPQNTIRRFVARYDGREIFTAQLGSGVGANPYLQFFIRATKSGEVVCEWVDDRGAAGMVKAMVTVTA